MSSYEAASHNKNNQTTVDYLEPNSNESALHGAWVPGT